VEGVYETDGDGGARDRGRSGGKLSVASARGDRLWHRALGVGLLISLVVHAAVLLTMEEAPIPDAEYAAGPGTADPRAAAGGGSGLEMIQVRPTTPAEEEVTPVEVPVPVPRVVVEPEVVETPPEEPAEDAAASQPGRGAPGEGGEEGTAEGPGRAAGEGEGAGGTGEEGASGIVPPRPRGQIFPPTDRPASVRGLVVTVHLLVDESGRVVPGSVRLDPPTPDAGYNRRLIRSSSEWRFDPARQNGRPVRAPYSFQVYL
jgi:hypothetical protein